MSEAEEQKNKHPQGKEAGPTRSFDGSVVGPGSQIGPFRIEHELGRGGAGVVYLAHDTKLDRSVAIKSLPPEVKDNPKALSRFTREAKVLASLNHPNIATIYDELEEAEGLIYLVLEYVPGQTLAERIAKKPLKLEEALTIAMQIAEAVAAAHEHDVIHRDLKPGNIKITEEGKVKVLDFGLAKVVGGEGTDQKTTITEPGRVIGTPAYMSPEQARGKPTDKRSDIWSFGCVLYEMLTGKIPFKGETISDTLAAILEHEPDWQALPESTPTNIRVLLRHCLDKEPRRRVRDIGDIAITVEATTIELQRSTLPMKPVKVELAQTTKWSRRALPWFITGVAVATLIFLGLVIALKFVESPEKQPAKLILPTTAKPIKAIVVLPFDNLSGDPEQEYFVDGMTDALSAELGKIKALRVISRTSAMRYKDTDKSIPEIARELGVDAVIEGSVLKAGNDVRVTAQLVDGRTDAHLWSDNYTGTLTNILALQSQVTLAIAREVEAALTPEEEASITRTEAVNPEAYEAYLKGRFFTEKETEKSFKTAADYFEQAIDIEPDYAEAYAWLAAAYYLPSIWGYSRPSEIILKSKSAAAKAVALDETLPMAHVAVGYIALAYDWQWQKAKESFDRAIELNPNYSRGYASLAWYFVVAGRFDEAIEMMQTAVKLDPLSPVLNKDLANVHMYSGQVERAIEQHKEALKLDPSHLDTLSDLARDYLIMSRYADAEKSIEEALNHHGRTAGLVASLARTYALWGRKGEAEKLLRELQDRDRDEYILPSDFARIHAALGNKDEALTWLEKAYQEREYFMVLIRVSPWWDSLRSDIRFEDLVQRMNFPEAPDLGTAAKPSEVTKAPIEKIAVLPFTSFSRESDEEWFVDGMTDALITQLGKIKALTIISRTSAMQYKNISKPMPEIAKDLGVDALIEGSVRRAGNDVEIIARLIDGRTDERIWDDLFHGTFSNILALQSQVTLAIAREIEAALTPDEETRITRTEAVNPKAHEAYLKGKFFWNKRTEDGSKTAIHYFEQAIEQDPSYALAHAGLADCYNLLGFYTHLEPNEAFPKAKREAQKALNIDDTIAEAYASLGYISLLYEWDWKRAESQLKRAIDLNPNYATAHHWYSVFLSTIERHDESIDKAKQAQKLDPGSNIINTNVGFSYYNKRQYNQAVEAFQNALLIDEGFWYAHWGLGLTYVQKEMYEKALTEHQKAKDLYKGWQPVIEMGIGLTYGRMGRRKEAQQVLDNLLERSKHQYVPPFVVAILYFSLQENDQGFTWLEKAYKIRNPQLSFLGSSPLYDSARSDPRFTVMLKKMRLDK